MSYETDIKLDEDALDIECCEQADKMLKYCKLQARWQRTEELAKERLDLVKAELDKEIRMDPEKFDLSKLTESVIFSTIISTKEYREANEKYLNAKYENNVAKGAVRSFDHRKTMIETLVKLHGQQYFAGPRVPRDLSAERKKKHEEANKRIGGSMRKKRRKNEDETDET